MLVLTCTRYSFKHIQAMIRRYQQVEEPLQYVPPDPSASAVERGPVKLQSVDEGGSLRAPLVEAHQLDELGVNPLAAVEDDPDLFHTPLAPTFERPSPCELHGPLMKRSERHGFGLLHAASTLFELDADWRERYFVLSGSKLLYWGSKADLTSCLQGHAIRSPAGMALIAGMANATGAAAAGTAAPRAADGEQLAEGSVEQSGSLAPPRQLPKVIDLLGYEVSVDLHDQRHGLTLRPSPPDHSKRSWHLRAPSEQARTLWTQKLVAVIGWAGRAHAASLAASIQHDSYGR